MTKIEVARAEYVDWCDSIGVKNLEDLSRIMKSGYTIPLINISEARQERAYAAIAGQIEWNRNRCPVVMLSGPSSSGKTSTTKRIALQCAAGGILPQMLELDDYFLDRENTPKDENGEYDFESLGAMDVELLVEHIDALLDGREIEVPRYDFPTGKRVWEGRKVKLKQGQVLFMEGIHALNPALTPGLDLSRVFKIYVSALTALPGGEKDHNSTTDKRLLRRILRDNRTRGISPEETILRWPSVRRGEIRNVFPYEENADVVFNSSTLYDLPLLKKFAVPLLADINPSSPAAPVAERIMSFLRKVPALTDEETAAIPPTSVMREFIGGQTL